MNGTFAGELVRRTPNSGGDFTPGLNESVKCDHHITGERVDLARRTVLFLRDRECSKGH